LCANLAFRPLANREARNRALSMPTNPTLSRAIGWVAGRSSLLA
jgi:hypothetical protein